MDFAATPFQIKQLSDSGQIEGLAAAFNNIDHGGDKMLPGSLTKSLADRGGNPLPMLMCHDLKRPIGAWTEWQERPEGLHVKGSIATMTRDGAEAYALAQAGALTGISIGYVAESKGYEGGTRVLRTVHLHEASLVPVPMNSLTRVSAVKSIGGVRDIEDLFREGGLSSRRAKFAAGAAWKAINSTDDETEAEAEAIAILNASAARIAAMKEK